jgi:hypothetical protein
LVAISGAGADLSIIVGSNGVATTITGFNDAGLYYATLQGGANFRFLSNVTVQSAAQQGVGGLFLHGGTVGKIVHDSHFSGIFGIAVDSLNNSIIGPNNVVTNWWAYGIYLSEGANNKIHNNFVGSMAGELGGVGVAISNQVGASETVINNNTVVPFGGVFGISNQSPQGALLNNYISCTTHEGIAAVGTIASGSIISGNYLFWSGPSTTGSTPAQCTSDDYGMSSADDGTHSLKWGNITNNYISGSLGPGIEIIGSGGSATIQQFNISNNTLQNAGSGFCGIQIEGSNVSLMQIGTNNFINSSSQTYDVCEATTNGTPNNNTVGIQNGTPGSSGTVHILGAGSHYLTRPTQVAGPSAY